MPRRFCARSFSFSAVGDGFRHLALQNDVTPVALQFFRQFARRNFQRVAQQRNERLAIIQVRRIGDDRLDRSVVREDFVVRVENRAALGEDRLLVDVFFRGEPGVLVVLDHLQINQPEGKGAEQRREPEADQRATNPAVPLHLPARLFATGWTASSPSGRGGALKRTMFCSAIGIIFR